MAQTYRRGAKKKQNPLPAFEVTFEPTTIEHLGLQLYSTLPPVISEFVSNAYDAEASKVEIKLPTGRISSGSEVIIRDYGHGMTAEELNQEFLPIGRKRRGPDATKVLSKHGRRRVTGRKGLGKLSGFGVAKEMEVRSIKAGLAVCLRLDYDAMQSWVQRHGVRVPYRPDVVEARTGETKEPDGVEIALRGLHRKRAISEDGVRRGLAQRLSFIGTGFTVQVNGKPIRPGDRLNRGECVLSWDVKEIPIKGLAGRSLPVKGWIGFLEESSQKGRGIDIFAAGKAAQLGTYFHYPSTHAQFARAHLVGEVHADFLDGNADLISTARNSVLWESEIGQQLEAWGQGVLKWAFDQWVAARRKRKEEQVVRETGFDTWMRTRSPREQRVAQKMVSLLIDNEEMSAGSAKPLLEIIKTSVETVAFRDLVDTIEAEGGKPGTLLKLFDEWRIIEAREHLKLAYGRLEALNKLEKFIDEGALEVLQIQPLLAKNPWIIDPAWNETNIEQSYSKLLKRYAKEPPAIPSSDKRIDIWGIRAGTAVTVVELKRPQKVLTWESLDQIENYVSWARSEIVGTGPHAPRYVNGLLVVGSLTEEGRIRERMARLAGADIRVETFRDLYVAARAFYDELDRRLQVVAPEYASLLRQKSGATRRAPRRHPRRSTN